MPKRQKQHVVGHYKKPKMMDNVEQVEEKLLKEQESLKEIEKNLSKEKSKIAHLDELIVHSKKKIAKYKKEKEQAECCRSETEQQLAAKTKQILKLQSIKNCLLNPVTLCPDLYADVFSEFIYNHSEDSSGRRLYNDEFLTKFIMIGKESLPAFIRILERSSYVCLIFLYDIEIQFAGHLSLYFNDTKLSQTLIQIIAPYATEIHFDDREKLTECQKSFFESLLKNQKQKKLEISRIGRVHECIAVVLQKLHEKRIFLEFEKLSSQVLRELPALKYDVLHIDDDNQECFQALKESSCSFHKLYFNDCYESLEKSFIIDYVEEVEIHCRVYKGFKKIFVELKKYFPNAKKVILRCFGSDYKLNSLCVRIKEIVEKAPQTDILVTLDLFKINHSKLLLFNGKKIDDKTYQWTSGENKSVILKFDIILVRHLDLLFSESDSSRTDSD